MGPQAVQGSTVLVLRSLSDRDQENPWIPHEGRGNDPWGGGKLRHGVFENCLPEVKDVRMN